MLNKREKLVLKDLIFKRQSAELQSSALVLLPCVKYIGERIITCLEKKQLT